MSGATGRAPVRIGVLGIAGRMGRLLAEEAEATGGATSLAGGTLGASGGEGRPWRVFADAAALAAACDALVDFTAAASAEAHARAAAAAGVAFVLGTSGLSAAQEAAVAEAARSVPVVYAANFSPGVNLAIALARRMAAALPASEYDAEVAEMHHRRKVDSPSGTALALGRAVAAGRGTTLEAAGAEAGRDGHHGPRRAGAVGFASLRGGAVVGEHTLLFASDAEHIALVHRSFDRRVYATGAVRAALWAVGRPPGLYGMGDVLGVG